MDKYNGQTKIREWYKECYPTDGMWSEINQNATFQDAFECLQVGFNFYAFLGVDDSLIRERVFEALATLMGCSYEHIYYQWLNESKEPFGLQLVTDMQGLRFKKNEDEKDKKIAELEKRVSDADWRYEYDHADDWRKPTEMGQL
jgi:hypothetical protein